MNDGSTTFRLAIVSTPRSGNTWLRGLLAKLYGLKEISAHRPEEIDWDNLPPRCVIQIHWPPWTKFLARLDRNNVRVVVLARHPLDVLMSWLNHVYYMHLEGYCPGPEACPECSIVGALPRSEAFMKYATGEYARMLLGYSPWWWHRPEVLAVPYADLVADAGSVLSRLAKEFDESPRVPIAEVVESSKIDRMKPSHDVRQFHYWQGNPGLWRLMLPAADARAIAAAVPEPFDLLGYDCDPDESLDPAQADLNWLRLQLDSTREHLTIGHQKQLKKANDLAALRVSLERVRQSLRDEQQAHDETRLALASARDDLGAVSERLAPLMESLARTHQSLREETRSHAETLRVLLALRAGLDAANRRLMDFDELGPTLLRFASGLRRLAQPGRRAVAALTNPRLLLPFTGRFHRAHVPPGPHAPARTVDVSKRR